MDKDLVTRQSSEIEAVRGKHRAIPQTRGGWFITGITFVGTAIVCAFSHFDGGTMLGGLFVVGTVSGFSDDALHALLYGRRFPEQLASTGKTFHMSESASDLVHRLLGFEREADPRNSFKAKTARMLGMPEPDYDDSSDVSRDILQEESAGWDESWYDEEEELPPMTTSSDIFTFSQVLADGFVPSLKKIFLARLPDGCDVYIEAKDLCHVALAGLTGNGKGVIMRLLMAQLCKIGAHILLLNPHYTRFDREADEDWTPFEPYLIKPACFEYEDIEYQLKWVANTLLQQRKVKKRNGQPVGKPFFIIIDELPAIVPHAKSAPGYIAEILREGRKYGIYLIVASQDFQVKTIGFDGGGVRKCFKTACYVGGDVATAKALLNDSPNDKIPENDLGKGTIMLRCSATKQAVVAKVPFVDNESLYRLLGPSTFSQRRASMPLVPLSKPYASDPYKELAEMPDIDPDDSRYEGKEEAKIIPIGRDNKTKQEVSIPKQTFNMLVRLRNAGKLSGFREIQDLLDCTETHARNVNKLIDEACVSGRQGDREEG